MSFHGVGRWRQYWQRRIIHQYIAIFVTHVYSGLPATLKTVPSILPLVTNFFGREILISSRARGNQLLALFTPFTSIFVWAAALAATLAAEIALSVVLTDLRSTALLLAFICKTSLYIVSNTWFVLLRGDTSLASRPLSLMLADRSATAVLLGSYVRPLCMLYQVHSLY